MNIKLRESVIAAPNGGVFATTQAPQPKRRSNSDIINELMDFSKFGQMSEVFIVNAVRAYCKTIVDAPRPVDVGNEFISQEMWYDLAEDTKQRIDQMYAENEDPNARLYK